MSFCFDGEDTATSRSTRNLREKKRKPQVLERVEDLRPSRDGTFNLEGFRNDPGASLRLKRQVRQALDRSGLNGLALCELRLYVSSMDRRNVLSFLRGFSSVLGVSIQPEQVRCRRRGGFKADAQNLREDARRVTQDFCRSVDKAVRSADHVG